MRESRSGTVVLDHDPVVVIFTGNYQFGYFVASPLEQEVFILSMQERIQE